MRHWQAIPVAAVAALLTGAALFTSAPPVTQAAGPVQIAIDCDTATGAIDTACALPAFPGTSTVTVGVVLVNNDVVPHSISAMNFHLLNPDASFLLPPVSANPNILDRNPNFNQAALVAAGWDCSGNPPVPDDGNGAPGTTISVLSCFVASGLGDTVGAGSSVLLGTVNYDVLKDGIVSLTLAGGSVADDDTVVLADCDSGDCVGASVQVGTLFVATSTPTVTFTPTATTPPIVGTPTSLAFVTVTPTGSPTVPATATPAAGESPVAGESPTTGGGGQPTGNEPGGGAGAGGGRPITLPDTGSGAQGGIDWTAASLFVLVALAAGALAGGLYFGAARITESRRDPRND